MSLLSLRCLENKMFVIFNSLSLCPMLSWLLTNMSELRKYCTEEDAEIRKLLSIKANWTLYIFLRECQCDE